jgi:uncharacterized protein (TIGR03437 family)
MGTVTVTDPLPAGLTAISASGTGWTCSVDAVPLCSRNDTLAGGASYSPIALTVSVDSNVTAAIVNTVSVSGGGDRTPANNTATDSGSVTPSALPDLSITKTANGTFVAGQTGTYTIVVSNALSAGPTTAPVTVTDSMPTGLTAVSATGDGWACTVGATVTCTRSDVLAPGASYPPITLTVNIDPNPPSSVTNIATASGGGDNTPNVNPPNPTPINGPADLSIIKTRNTTLTPGQPATYTIVVSNAANAGPTTGTVTVSDTLPPGLTAVSASGPGWTCTTGPTVTCTRSDVLAPGASYPPITLTVNVAADAPLTTSNSACVAGGGDQSGANNCGSDPLPPANTCLSIAATAGPNFGSGLTGAFSVVVSNPPGTAASSGKVVVAGATPLFTTPISATGTGWDCTVLTQAIACSRSDSLAPGAQFPPIAVLVKFTSQAPGSTGTATFYVANAACARPATVPVQIPDNGPQGPQITLVTNAASFVTPGQSNYGVAPGSLVTIFGNQLGPATPAQVQSLPLDPAGFAGVHAKATVGSTSLDVPVVFASANQLNVMLPSSIPPGDGSFEITFNGQTTPPFPFRVLKTVLGIFAPNRQGYGPASAQNAFPGDIVEENSLITPVAPGQIVELWGTGLGPVQGNEFAVPLPGNIDVPVEIFAGGQKLQPIYAGRSGCCVGTDQIHFVVPGTLQGCYVPVFVKAGNLVSNTITLSVSGSDFCADPGGLTSQQVRQLNAGGALINAVITLNRTILPDNTKQDFGLAAYSNLNRLSVLTAEPEFRIPPSGSCVVGQSHRDGQGMTPAPPFYVPADALSVFPLRENAIALMTAGRPEVSSGGTTQTLVPDVELRYSALLGPSSSTFLDPGLVTVSNDDRNAPLGLVPQSVILPPAPQAGGWQQSGTNNPTTINRGLPLTVQWSGGDPANDLALISGFKSIAALTGGMQGTTATSWFVCTAPIDAGTFTVPAEVLQAMPTGLPITGPGGQRLPWLPGGDLNDVTTKKSSLSIGSIRKPDVSRFTTPGVDIGKLIYVLVTKQNVDYQ